LPLWLSPENGRLRRLWLWSVPATLLAFLFFFWGWEQSYLPASYAFAAAPALLLLSAAGISLAARRLSVPAARLLPPVVLPALLLFLPAHLRSFDDHFYNMEKSLPAIVGKAGVRNAVVFCDAIDRGPRNTPYGRYDYFARAFLMNDLAFEEGDVVYARNLRERNPEMIASHPDRDFYLYRFRRRDGLAELYRIDLSGPEPVYRFVPVDDPRAADPNGRLSIPNPGETGRSGESAKPR
jgi:hypothetical protein